MCSARLFRLPSSCFHREPRYRFCPVSSLRLRQDTLRCRPLTTKSPHRRRSPPRLRRRAAFSCLVASWQRSLVASRMHPFTCQPMQTGSWSTAVLQPSLSCPCRLRNTPLFPQLVSQPGWFRRRSLQPQCHRWPPQHRAMTSPPLLPECNSKSPDTRQVSLRPIVTVSQSGRCHGKAPTRPRTSRRWCRLAPCKKSVRPSVIPEQFKFRLPTVTTERASRLVLKKRGSLCC